MTISVTGTPSAPTETNGGTSVARNCGTCVTGELLNITVSGVSDTFTPTAGQVTQTSGTGTLGTVSLDHYAIGNNGDGGYTFSAQWSAIVTAGGTITVTAASFPSGSYLTISHQRISSTVGWDSSRVVAVNGQHTATDSASALSTGNATSTAEAIFVAGLALNNGASVTVTTPSGWTAITDNGGNGATAVVLAHAYRIETSGGTHACAWTFSALDGSTYNGQAATVVAYQEAAPSATLDQDGFRFGLDDGSESAHTWAAAQNADLTRTLGSAFLLRTLLQTTGDKGAPTPVLRAQKNGTGGYQVVPVGASSSTTTSPSQPSSGTGTTVGTASTTWNLTRPSASSGDLVVFVVGWDDSTTVSSVTAPAGPNGETAVSIAGPVASASTEVRVQAWYYLATGTWSGGTSAWTPSASETCRAVAFVIPAGQFNASDIIGWSNTLASAGTAEATVASPTGTADADDGDGRLFIAYCSDADAITAPASGTTTVNNATGGGVGLCVVSRNTLVSNSESVAAINATIASDSWASLAFVVHPDVDTVDNELYIAASANITAGGEATTSRLTGGTGTFLTGRRWDDENGSDALGDPSSDQNTEVEWSLNTQAPATDGDYWDFRVYDGSNPLDAYTEEPRLTIGTPATPSLLLPQSVFARVPALRRF